MLGHAFGLVLVVAACGGTYHARSPEAPSGPPRGVEAAALPYYVLDARTGHQLAKAAFWSKLAAARVVCVGEEHPNPHHHWVQLEVVRHLVKVWPHVVLGMEMVQRPFQGVLDDFAAGRIDEDAMLSRVGWADRWGYKYSLYRPIIQAVLAAHGKLLALNAARELTTKVAHHGLESLSPAQRARLPQLDLHDAAHRAWFNDIMSQMGGAVAHSKKPASGDAAKDKAKADKDKAKADKDKPADPNGSDDPEGGLDPERVYTVQVIWDETMADTTARWLAAHPADRVVILAGDGHCHDSAIVSRIKRRGVHRVVSVRTVIDDGQGSVADELAKPINDFLVVLEPPPDVKAKLRAEDQ